MYNESFHIQEIGYKNDNSTTSNLLLFLNEMVKWLMNQKNRI